MERKRARTSGPSGCEQCKATFSPSGLTAAGRSHCKDGRRCFTPKITEE